MLPRKAAGPLALAFLALALPATALALRLRAAAHRRPTRVARMPTARPSRGVPAIGALYANARATLHGCTASVVHSPRGDMLMTAAHCVVGRGAGMVFVPDQDGARQHFGRWTVTAVHLEAKWVTRQDPDADLAFLTVAPQTINGVPTEIERVTGGYRLGATAARRQIVTVTGYPAGGANDPITCRARVYLTKWFPSFDCRGYVGGTSGSPWLRATRHGTQIVGVIGGLNQGGCHDYTSYSSRLQADADGAYHRAAVHGPADVAPRPGSDGC
jgi:V8-like Glu-specific endopeptidase